MSRGRMEATRKGAAVTVDGRRAEVHLVRGLEVEVELEQGGRRGGDHQRVRLVEHDLELHDPDGVAVRVHDAGLGRQAVHLDAHRGVREVEAHDGPLVGAGRDVLDRDELGDVRQIGEIDPLAGGQDLHVVAIAVLEANRDQVYGIGEEVPVRVGQGDADLAAGGGRAVGGRRVVVVIRGGQDDAAAVAAGGEGEEISNNCC